MFAIYLYHKEEKRKEELFSDRRELRRRAVWSDSVRQHWLSSAFSLIPSSMHPQFSLHVRRCLIGCSAIMKMFYICNVHYTMTTRHKWVFKFKSIKTKFKIQFISHVASDYQFGWKMTLCFSYSAYHLLSPDLEPESFPLFSQIFIEGLFCTRHILCPETE